MYVVFVEYMIFSNRIEDYLAYITRIKQNNPTMDLLESADQAGLFVEIWREVSDEDFITMKQERTEAANSAYAAVLNEMLDNKKPIQMWKFSPKNLNVI